MHAHADELLPDLLWQVRILHQVDHLAAGVGEDWLHAPGNVVLDPILQESGVGVYDRYG